MHSVKKKPKKAKGKRGPYNKKGRPGKAKIELTSHEMHSDIEGPPRELETETEAEFVRDGDDEDEDEESGIVKDLDFEHEFDESDEKFSRKTSRNTRVDEDPDLKIR